ncbi:Stk1 family PASTA domain-containing Ser/Thr kinase [Lachnoanaerobaculum saburreum]|uniref:non-specific serine/threonine protein kinase n=1 Tax=Lachnoanaerobaculum saburreum TaxID=467210 RepID=A0A133ZHK7_9FIRM|nr:Stk1 family PASTA domain-containing Ser/Thr kinase [Lachnoanaerobaculum saburreum]KXB54900.1 putative serine/threonine-protein kinase PrkC [Lachnoanaerobaculum saburreum]
MNLESVVLQGRYEIIEKIGSGGMSNVFRAKDLKLGRMVAIKVLKDEFCTDLNFVEKFKREAQAAASLLGENIVNIYDVVDEGRYHFIVMELVDGITLKEYIRIKGKLDITEGVSIAIQVARALKTAHAQHIVHRDIKPQNILITDDSKVKVADFGIARAVSEQTVNANAIGSVHYISPEQARGGRCDARSDIYSLGITMYEMFTGRVPFTGESTVAVALAHLEQAMTPPSIYNNKISPNLERIILKCTKKDPANRYQNITELLDDLENVLLNPDTPYEISGSTKIIKAEDTAMLSQVEPIDDMSDDEHERDDKEEEEDDDDEYDEEDEKMDKIMSVAGVIIAVIIVVLLVFFVGRFTGVFGGKGSDTSQSKLDSTQTKMPDVVGLSEKMADKKLSDNNLQMQVKSSEYSDTVEKGNVISQEPKADEVVSKYSKVSVVISLGSDAFDISKLNLVGKTKESAESLLKENGFSTDTKEEPSDTVPKGSVISYTPTKPKNGERVTLTVSSGKKVTKVVVPNITGMSESEAKTLLETNGLILGNKAEQHSATVAKGIIIGQSTAAGSSVDSGSSVDYAVSNGVAPETTQASSEQLSQSTNEQQTQPTKATVAPTSAAANYRYVGSIDTNYSLQDVIGPSSGLTSVKVMIRLKQTVNGSDVYSTLMDARTVTGDTILPVRFRTIVGANGVDQGQVEIVNVDSGEVLKSYTVEFFRVE